MKRLASPLIALLACGSLPFALHAGPRFAQGDVYLSGTVQISESSNVGIRSGGSSDTIYAFIPTLSYVRESNRLDLNASLSTPIRRYDRNDALDSESLSFNLNGEVPYGANPRLSGDWNISYFDGVQESFLTNRNLDSTNFSASIYSDYAFSGRLSARARLQYSDRDNSGIRSDFLNANESSLFAIGLHARELVRGRIGVYTEYVVRQRKTNFGLVNQGVDDTDDGINFGLTGQILPERLFPKLEADLSFGFTSTEASDRVRNRPDAGRSNRLTLNGSLRYPANPRTNVSLNFSRNLEVTDDDRTVERGQVQLAVDYSPRQRLTFIGSVGLSNNDFIYDEESRSDDVLTFNLGANYSIRQNWSARLSYDYRDSASNIALSDYSRSILTLSSTIRY